MIDRDIKKCLGQMTKGVQVVATTHDGPLLSPLMLLLRRNGPLGP